MSAARHHHPRSVVLVTIDSLRYDRLSATVGTRNCTPTLDRLIREGEWYPRAYANSWYTQFSFPAILASARPLSHGGYDLGIATRPKTLAECLRERGLSTAAFSTDPYLNAYYGYDRGFDSFFELFDLGALWEHVCRDYVAHYARLAESGGITQQQLQQLLQPLLDRLLAYAASYCAAKLNAHERTLHHVDAAFYSQDFAALERSISRQREALHIDDDEYIQTLLTLPEVQAAIRGSTGSSNSTAIEHLAGRLERHSVAARDLVSLQLAWLAQQGNNPCFTWLSLNDVHDAPLEHLDGATHDEARNDDNAPAPDIREHVRRNRAREDAALNAVDQSIHDLIAGLQSMGRLETTMLVICADHGRLPGTTGFGGLFADALVRVPLIFWNTGQPASVRSVPCSLVDIGPTILERLQLQPEPAFDGSTLTADPATARDYVVIEQLGAGPCDLERRQPLICLVGRHFKYVWSPDGREWLNQLDERPRRGFVTPSEAQEEWVTELRQKAQHRYQQIMQDAGYALPHV